jgi:hypothetical protein
MNEVHTGNLYALLGHSLLSYSIVNALILLVQEQVEQLGETSLEVCNLNVIDKLWQGIDWVAYKLNPDDPEHR